MKRVGCKDTAPELAVRRYLHSVGLRYALHRRDLPGKPDLVLPRRRSVVFVHGCFWHGHGCRHGSVKAKSNSAYWLAKIEDNRRRDRHQQAELRQLGWRVEIIWECQVDNPRALARIAEHLLVR